MLTFWILFLFLLAHARLLLASPTLLAYDDDGGDQRKQDEADGSHPVGKVISGYVGSWAESLKNYVAGGTSGDDGSTPSVWVQKAHYLIDTVASGTREAVDPPKGQKSITENAQEVLVDAKNAAVNAISPSKSDATLGDRASGVVDFFAKTAKKLVDPDRIDKVANFFKGLFG
uniref:Secreted protein n=1 Tax=Romanomermis culicivorax TaxID=13658 RepID=A0A915KSV5_ROMCU